jgi:hypothetical protein
MGPEVSRTPAGMTRPHDRAHRPRRKPRAPTHCLRKEPASPRGHSNIPKLLFSGSGPGACDGLYESPCAPQVALSNCHDQFATCGAQAGFRKPSGYLNPCKTTLSSQGSIFTPHPTPPPSSQPVRNLVDPAWTLPFNSASDGLPAPRRPRRDRPVGVHNTPRLQICTVVILWFDVIKRALRGGRRGGRVDAKRCRGAVLGW